MSSDAISTALIVLVSFGIPVLIVIWAFFKFRGTTSTIKGGIPAEALIQSLAETGMTVSTPSAGPEAPVYRIGLLVNPPGGAPYAVEDTHAIPRLYIPMTVPGAQIGVLIDPKNPMKVVPDWSRISGSAKPAAYRAGAFQPAGYQPGADQAGMADPGAGMSEAAAILSGAGSVAGTVMENPGGVNVSFDAQGNPVSGVNDMIGAVRSGAMPTIKGKAAQILATGTHGTAVITTAQPLGQTVRDIDPSADPSRLNDPIWLFTVEVSLAGIKPFPAMFGHRVPLAKVAQVAPGVQLAVAVDESNPSQEVAIDWDRSPIGTTA
jgi:hypothetical protein